jgi:outer membrane lipoprotein-sorting protein
MRFSKNLVFNKISGIFLAAILPVFVLANVLTDQNTPAFDSLKQQFETGNVYTASFVHEYNDTFTGEQQRTEGTIWVGKERYKIISGSNIMVVDGEISQVYDSSRNRVIISDYVEEEDDFAPSRMLQGVDDTYSVSEYRHSNRTTEILLSSNDPFTIFIQVTIFLDEEGVPMRIEAIDQVENELTTFFIDGSFIPEDPDIFLFEYPESAEQIDLRHDS